MSMLKNISRGKKPRPFSLLLTGVEGVGKTSFAASAPEPLFLDVESGSCELDVARTEPPKSLQDVYDLISELRKQEGAGFRTLVVDTIDALDPLVAAHVCSKTGWETLDSPGYGKGPAAALAEWRVLLAALEKLRTETGMNLILVGHVEIKRFTNPGGDDYDRFQPNMPVKTGNLIKASVDAHLFCEHEVEVLKEKGSFKAKGQATGRRVIRTERTAAYDAKNRFALPPTLPLEWAAFERAKNIEARYEELVAGLTDEERTRHKDWFAKQKDKRAAMITALKHKEASTNG